MKDKLKIIAPTVIIFSILLFIFLYSPLSTKNKNDLKKIKLETIIPLMLKSGCVKKPNQDFINNALKFASRKGNIIRLKGKCIRKEYRYETLDEQRRRILKLYVDLAIKKLNQQCIGYGEKTNTMPFNFTFIEFVKAISNMDKKGNTRWRVNILVEEVSLHLSLRLNLDFVIYVYPSKSENPNAKSDCLSCAEYTTFPFPKYFIGYPSLDQMIPLPSQVISTGPGLVLSQAGKSAEFPNFKKLYLNRVWMENSDLALGTELPTTLQCHTSPAINDTNLASSAYPSTRITRDQIKFPEKFYADCLDKKGKVIDTDICNNYKWKPPNYHINSKSENSYHFKGNTESYEDSMLKPDYPNGWIQPAKWRNKWPRLWSEPRDRFAYPSVPVGQYWNNLGVRYPIPEPDDKHPGIRWSAQQIPRTPLYWPTITGLPISGGPNYWLFDPTRGFNANLPHGGPNA